MSACFAHSLLDRDPGGQRAVPEVQTRLLSTRPKTCSRFLDSKAKCQTLSVINAVFASFGEFHDFPVVPIIVLLTLLVWASRATANNPG
jgi:hypothetical protein